MLYYCFDWALHWAHLFILMSMCLYFCFLPIVTSPNNNLLLKSFGWIFRNVFASGELATRKNQLDFRSDLHSDPDPGILYLLHVLAIWIKQHYFYYCLLAVSTTMPTVLLPLTSIWPHLNSDVGLEEGEY